MHLHEYDTFAIHRGAAGGRRSGLSEVRRDIGVLYSVVEVGGSLQLFWNTDRADTEESFEIDLLLFAVTWSRKGRSNIQEKTPIPIHFLHDKQRSLCMFCMTNWMGMGVFSWISNGLVFWAPAVEQAALLLSACEDHAEEELVEEVIVRKKCYSIHNVLQAKQDRQALSCRICIKASLHRCFPVGFLHYELSLSCRELCVAEFTTNV